MPSVRGLLKAAAFRHLPTSTLHVVLLAPVSSLQRPIALTHRSFSPRAPSVPSYSGIFIGGWADALHTQQQPAFNYGDVQIFLFITGKPLDAFQRHVPIGSFSICKSEIPLLRWCRFSLMQTERYYHRREAFSVG